MSSSNHTGFVLTPRLLLAVLMLTGSASALAQDAQSSTAATAQHQHPTGHQPPSLFSPREVSGTAWFPDETPMYGATREWRGWEVMVHGVAFVQILYEPGYIHRTGGFSTYQAGSVNWGMLMARRPLGAGRVGLRLMGSAEPWTLPGCGSINLLATGEMCEGDTIHDRQHPHDLFMELAADYDRPLRGNVRWQIYGGSGRRACAWASRFPTPRVRAGQPRRSNRSPLA